MNTTTRSPRVLSIASTDPSGGAGIQADLKSIAANGGYAMAVITALVAQNTTGVRSIHTPPVEFLAEQLHAVSDDVRIDAVKIGMLFDTPIIATVDDWLQTIRPPIVVLDPVMVAASGDRLLTASAETALRDLISSVDLVTPNIPELAALLDRAPATNWDEAVEQARELAEAHQVRVLMKGGHLDGDTATDALIHPSTQTAQSAQAGGPAVVEFSAPRIDTRNTHGTGCSLSAAIATLQPQLGGWGPAIGEAKAWLTESIEAADDLHVGNGNGPISHFAGLWRRAHPATEPTTGPVTTGTVALESVTAESVAGQWWAGIEDIRAAIDELDFITGLVDGSLDEAAFTWYLAQDALYLKDYSRALAEASKLAPTPAEQAFWAHSAHGAIATELELHANWLPSESMFDATASPVTTGYVNHLLATAARGSYEELIAAVLPCFWIYVDVGSRLVHHATTSNPYAAWLQTYGDPAFEDLNRQAIEIVTAHAATATPTGRERMRSAFTTSAQHELNCFAAPLHQEPQHLAMGRL